MLSKLFLVGLGGFVGAILRYGFSGLVQDWSKSISFPYGTLATNLVGCLVIGALSQLAESFGVFSSETRAFIFVGLIGAFTTYSTFGNETLNLIREGETFLSLANIGLHIILGLGAIWIGRILVVTVWR